VLIAVSAILIACDENGSNTQGRADRMNANKAGTAAQLSPADREFAINTTMVGRHEIELGQLASSRAMDGEVKAFADRMVKDHTSAGNDLSDITTRLGVTIPTEEDTTFNNLKDRLSKMKGTEFDRAYMAEMVQGHEKAAASVETYANSGNNADLKAWAAKAAPVIREHLQQAQKINTRLGAK